MKNNIANHIMTKIKYLEILVIIFVSVSPLISVRSKILIQIVMILLSYKYFKFKKKFIFILIICFVIPLIYDATLIIINNYSFSLASYMYLYNFITAYIISRKYEINEFLLILKNIIFILAVLSLIGILPYFINPDIIQDFPNYSFNNAIHKTIYFHNYLFIDNLMVIRNTGIAWEPGVFQFLLNIGLSLTIEDKKHYRYIKYVIYFFSIYFTKSTAGLIICIIICLRTIKTDKVILIIMLLLLIIFGQIIYVEYERQLDYKLIGTSAFNSRLIPSINAINTCWWRILGLGGTQYNDVITEWDIGSFDSYTQTLMRYGYPLLLFILMKLSDLWKYNKSLTIIIIITFFSEPLSGSILLVILYFLAEKNKYEKT